VILFESCMLQLIIKVLIQRNSLCEEVDPVSDQLPKYPMKIFLRDFNTKVGREDYFKTSNQE